MAGDRAGYRGGALTGDPALGAAVGIGADAAGSAGAVLSGGGTLAQAGGIFGGVGSAGASGFLGDPGDPDPGPQAPTFIGPPTPPPGASGDKTLTLVWTAQRAGCPTVPEKPGFVSLRANVAKAQRSAWLPTSILRLNWFYQQVRNRGPWDYKQNRSIDDFGHFGPRTCGHVDAGLGTLVSWASVRRRSR